MANTMDVRLPIDVVPGSNPPVFKWRQLVDTPNGKVVVDHQESLPPHLERAVERTISIAKQLLMENAALQGQVAAANAEVQERTAARQPVQQQTKKGK